jgi:flagellar motor protein MotB
VAKISLRALRRRSVDFESLWLITFADLMVQLMAFFAVIYSFSLQGEHQLNAVVKSLQKALGVTNTQTVPGTGILPGGAGVMPERGPDVEKLLSDLRSNEGPDVGTRMRIVSFRGSILFGENSAAIDPAFQPLLTRISQLVQDYPGFLLICEGHAAPHEKGRGSIDALDLSGQRAQTVMRFLVSQGLEAKDMAAEAHGDALIDGDPSSPEGRALQRRVKFRFQRVAP